jgi:hypothetical protein
LLCLEAASRVRTLEPEDITVCTQDDFGLDERGQRRQI